VAVKRARPDGVITFLPSTLSSPPAQKIDTCLQVIIFSCICTLGMHCTVLLGIQGRVGYYLIITATFSL